MRDASRLRRWTARCTARGEMRNHESSDGIGRSRELGAPRTVRTLRVLVADPDTTARAAICALLSRFQNVTVVGEARTGPEVMEMIERHAPDVAFLETQLPALDGFEILKELSPGSPVVIFVTSCEAAAVRAFETQALDYLIKPVTRERMSTSLARVRQWIRREHAARLESSMRALLSSMADGAPTIAASVTGAPGRAESAAARADEDPSSFLMMDAPSARLAVRVGRRCLLVPISDIDWISADDYYSTLHVRGRQHVMRETLGTLERRLDPRVFVRIHRSVVVNLSRIVEIQQDAERAMAVVLSDGTRLPISRNRRAGLTDRLGNVG
jgi:two-component system LytT family response regulator